MNWLLKLCINCAGGNMVRKSCVSGTRCLCLSSRHFFYLFVLWPLWQMSDTMTVGKVDRSADWKWDTEAVCPRSLPPVWSGSQEMNSHYHLKAVQWPLGSELVALLLMPVSKYPPTNTSKWCQWPPIGNGTSGSNFYNCFVMLSIWVLFALFPTLIYYRSPVLTLILYLQQPVLKE